MKKIRLGHSHLYVSPIGLGTIHFGTKLNKEESFEILDAYASQGGNFIDTANNYAVWNGGDGSESECVIGEWLTKHQNRQQFIIGTKCGALPKVKGNQDFSNMQGLKREVILNAVEQSLRNLQTDYIDILYLHVDDFSVSQFEVMETLNELIIEGKVKAIGCSNFYTWRIESAREICLQHHFAFFSVIQQRYSYLQPLIDADFYPQVALNQDLDAYLNYYDDLTLIAYSPLLKGQYSSLDYIIDSHYKTYENVERLNQLKLKGHPVHSALKYITDSYHGSIALITTSNRQHMMEIMKAYQ